jgi:SAM-dependent methyltransferase
VRDVQSCFSTRLIDLGERDRRFTGIYSPISELNEPSIGITDQFLADAATYHASYNETATFLGLFERIFERAGRPARDALVLDIGSGSGANSTIPILSLLDRCRVVATDLSPQLLSFLSVHAAANGLSDRIACVRTDAMQNHFSADIFDLVICTSSLHHLIDPAPTLVASHRALRAGGMAIFLEPFEGYALLKIAFGFILARADRDKLPLPASLRALLAAMIRDIDARIGTDKSHARFRHMDDKWLFTRAYLDRVCRNIGFGEVTLIPAMDLDHQFRTATSALLKQGANLPPDDMPEWAWEYIDAFDQSMSDDMKSDIPIYSAIVLRK